MVRQPLDLQNQTAGGSKISDHSRRNGRGRRRVRGRRGGLVHDLPEPNGDLICDRPASSQPISDRMRTILLLVVSNIFMTFAWYGHLKFKQSPLWLVILASWGIAFFEYC